MADDPWAVKSESSAQSDPWAVVSQSSHTPRKEPRYGLKAPDAAEKKRYEESKDTFAGTLAQDFTAIPMAIAEGVSHPFDAMLHPFHGASGLYQTIKNLPHDLETDLRQGKYGKLGARTLELILPGIGSERAASIAADADAAAARAAARITASRVPEAIGETVGEKITPGIVKEIRQRLHPAPKAPQPFKPGATTQRNLTKFTPDAESTAARSGMPSGSAGTSVRRGINRAIDVEPEAPPTPKAPEPFKPGATTLRNMTKYTPSSKGPEFARSYAGKPVRRGINRAMDKGPAEVSEMPKADTPAVKVEAPRAAGKKLADWLQSGKITKEQAKMMDSGDWALAARATGVKVNSEVIKWAIDQLRRAPSPKGRLKPPQ